MIRTRTLALLALGLLSSSWAACTPPPDDPMIIGRRDLGAGGGDLAGADLAQPGDDGGLPQPDMASNPNRPWSDVSIASGPQAYQSTGLFWCCSKYGDVSSASRLGMGRARS